MKQNRILIYLLLYLYFSTSSYEKNYAQTLSGIKAYPIVGKRCPDFALKGIQYYKTQNATLNDFKEKPFILYFFTTGCTACFKSLPKINQLKEDFGSQVEFIMIGRDDKYIRGTFEKFRKHYRLDLPVVYDTILFKQFGIETVPHILWGDSQGVVKAISYSSDLNHETVGAFLKEGGLKVGEKPNALVADSSLNFDYEKPLLLFGNGGSDSDFLYRSILAKWNKDKTGNPYFLEHLDYRLKNKVQLAGVSLSKMYALAYGDTIIFHRPLGAAEVETGRSNSYGEWWPVPVLEVSDTSLFQYDFSTGRGLYSYSLITPLALASTQYLKDSFQRELLNCFGYRVTIERRKMPCWKVIASKDGILKLSTKGEAPILAYKNHTGLFFSNQPMTSLIFALWASNSSEPPIVDATGIKGNIDLDLDTLLTDFSVMKDALHKKYGLDFVKGEKEMNVIVIRER